MAQLALPIAHPPTYLESDFLQAASNAAARAWLARTNDWPGGRLVLFGEAGCGKTHLLRVWAVRVGARLIDATTLRQPPPGPPDTALAIDDADRAADEPALLHWLNAATAAQTPVLLAGRASPTRWPTRLPDLSSRVRAATAVEVGAPEDTLLRALLARLLSDRQIAVPEAVQDYVLIRLPRTPAAIREAADRLDRAALEAGRPVSRSLAADVLAGLTADG